MRAIVEHECRALGLPVPHLSVEPGRAIAGPSTFTLYEVGTVKSVALDAGASRFYVAVDGGMSDNIRPALYDADFSCTLASRASERAAGACRGSSASTASPATSWSRTSSCPSDVGPGDLVAVPATGAYCRSLASTYNHVPRAAVVAVRDGQAALIVRRETEEDLLRLDVEMRRTSCMVDNPHRIFSDSAHCRRSLQHARSEGQQLMNTPVRVAMLGCGVVGSEVARLLIEQADDLVARVGAPLELVGIGVRRIDRDRAVDIPRELFTTDAEALVTPRRHRRRDRGDRRDRAGPVADPGGAGVRRVGGHRQQGAARRGRRHLVRGRREGRPRRLLRGGGRRRDPDHPAAARVAGRRQGAPRARHRQRHHQLHPRPDGHPRHRLRGGPRGRPEPRVRRGRPDRRRRGLRRRREGRDPRQPGVPHPGHGCRRLPRRHQRHHQRRRRLGPRDAARWSSCSRSASATSRRRRHGLGARAPGDDPAQPPAGQCPRGVQRGLRRERRRRSADVLRARAPAARRPRARCSATSSRWPATGSAR